MSRWLAWLVFLLAVLALWELVKAWPFLWEIGLLGLIGAAYFCFFRPNKTEQSVDNA